MQSHLHSRLAPVKLRQRWLLALRTAVYGLAVSSCIGIAVGVWRWAADQSVSPLTWGLLLAAGPVLGLVVGLIRGRSWHLAAEAVDRHYDLKDRTVTALEFTERTDESPFRELQVRDADEHLTGIEPRQVAPFGLPRLLPFAAGLLVAAVVLCVWPLASEQVAASTVIPGIIAVSLDLEEEINDLERLAKEQENEELDELVQELKEKVGEMQQPNVDVRDALATLSEIQTALQDQRAQYNEALVDAQLQALGSAMANAAALEAAGQQLQKGNLDEAAETLEKLEDAELTRREAKAVSEELKKVAESMDKAGLGQLSEAASEMAEGVSSGNNKQCCQGAKQISRSVRKHAMRKQLNRLLSQKLDKLSECKSRCQACQSCSMCGGQCSGDGECEGKNNSFALGFNPKKSDKASQNFGMGTSGNVFGEKTSLLSQKKMETITGTPGAGPSEVETTTSPEGRQQAQRAYRESFAEYQKLSEEVLDSEPIPLGHRQTIRRYFELIRPEGAEGESTP